MRRNPSRQVAPAARRFDGRTAAIMVGATLLGVAWASYNLISTGGARSETDLRPLVWVIFATPFFLCIGWVVARRVDFWRAAAICFCFYFFTPFVAARIESLVLGPQRAAETGHTFYFWAVIVLHLIVGSGISIWRALNEPPVCIEPEPESALLHAEH